MPSVRRDRSESNIEIYENAGIVKFYESWETGLLQGEALIISRIETEVSGKAILDIGVGAGRTTPALLKLSNKYIGIDVAPSMISASRERFPSVSFEVCDARDLSRFRDNSFDLVFFSFNGIDNLKHRGRLAALREIYRVLAHGGAFVFSSHNLRSIRKKPWHSTKLLSINPLTRPRDYSKHAIKAAIETVNYLRIKRREEYNDGSAFISDGSHGYGILQYHINVEAQMGQLKEVGFNSIETLDRNGSWMLPDDYSICQSLWLYYLCWKT